MERLEQALIEALSRNADETERWAKYKEQQQEAIDNMKRFGEKITLDVMVPVGTKAFMPGQLYHTNEIFVSHYQGFFSKCSSHQAQELAKHRMETAKIHLDGLEKERNMYQNKLDLPYADGAIAGGEEREIIENYDEQEEQIWRAEHRRKVREAKLKESKERENEQTDKDIMKMLDDLEIMEELEEELEKLQIEDDETLEKLMSGELKLPDEKHRLAHGVESKKLEADAEQDNNSRASIGDMNKIDFTNNNIIPNVDDYDSDAASSDTTTSEDIPDQIIQIEAEAKHLTTKEKINYFKKKLRVVEKELREMTVKSMSDIDEKMSRMEIREYLMDYIEILKDELDYDSHHRPTEKEEKSNGKKKRITFSQQDEVQIIDNKQAANAVTRSRIELADDSHHQREQSLVASKTEPEPVVDKKNEILAKVEKCFEFVSSNQSHQDFDLVGKIINSSELKNNTISIQFDHSEKFFAYPGYEVNDTECKAKQEEVIGSPADIYRVFKTFLPADMQPTDNYDRDDQAVIKPGITNPVISTAPAVTENILENDVNRELTKSILKNKEMVEIEKRSEDVPSNELKKKKSFTERVDFETIMGDVIENKNQPDPLPDEKFIDAFAPKKRISRFKQMRSNS